MKRRTHPSGRKGHHGPEVVQPRRPSKYARYIHNHSAEHGDAEAFARAVKSGCLIAGIISLLLCLAAVAAHAQPRFAFHAQSVYRFNNGRVDILPPMEVQAFSDTLLFWHPGQPARPYYNIAWTRTDDGSLYYLTTGVHILYLPGPGGQALYIRTFTPEMGAITLEAYERNIIKN